MNNVIKNNTLLFWSIFIYTLGFIAFISLVRINYSLIVGWIFGLISSLSTYITILFVYKMKGTFIANLYLGTLRSFLNLCIQIGLLIGIIAINQYVAGNHIFSKGLEATLKPINLFTYIASLTITIPLIVKLAIRER